MTATISIRALDCGMPLIVETIPGVASVGLSWLLPVGSAAEPEPLLGLGAMASQLLFRGAGALDSRAQADALDTLGVARAADVHTFSLELSATLLGSNLHHALPLLVDAVRAPRMDDASIEPVRDLCLQSLESLADEKQERLMLLLRERHAPHPINRSGLGSPEGLEAITREHLLQHWNARALPGGSVLAVAGDAHPDRLADDLNRLLAGWKGAPPQPSVGPLPARGYSHEPDDTNQTHIALAHDAPAEPHPDCPLERLLSAVLSGGMSGRLFSEVREKRNLCYAVYATYGADKTYGRVAAYVGSTPERAQDALDVLHAELARLTAAAPGGPAIDPGEFERAQTGLLSRLVMSGESTSARAAALAQDWRKLGRPRPLSELVDAARRVSLRDLQAYAARRSMGTPTIVTLGPAPLRPPAA